jgi:hypothetical protein
MPPAPFMAYESNITVPATPLGTAVTASATPHSKNTTYTQLIASTSFDAYAIQVMISDTFSSATNTSTLVDIAIGAAASESVIIPNLNAGYAQVSGGDERQGAQKYWFPLYIPAGSRLSATAQSAVASKAPRVCVWLFGEPLRPTWAGQIVTDYGTNLATSRGATVTCGVSAAEGSWAQITAATSKAHAFMAAGVSCDGDASVLSDVGLLDIGVGAATEQTIMEHLPFGLNTAEAMSTPFPFCCYAQVASGDRLAARASVINSGAQNIDVILYGLS